MQLMLLRNWNAEPVGQLDPQSLAVQSGGVLIGSPPFIAGKLPWSFGEVVLEWNQAHGTTRGVTSF